MQMDCGLLIKNIDLCLAKKANNSLIDDDITLSQLRFLSYLYEKDGYTASLKEMERFYDVSQPTVAGMMKRLERKGLVSTSPDPRDRRAKNATLTARGKNLLKHQETFHCMTQNTLLEPLAPEERIAFMDMLQRVWENIKDEISEAEIEEGRIVPRSSPEETQA